VSVREGVDFTFKKSFVDNRSEINVISYNKVFSSPNKFNEAIEYSSSKDNFKQSVTSFSRAFADKEIEEKAFTNYMTDNKDKDIKKNNTVSFHNQILNHNDKIIKLTPVNVYAEENIILDDEFVPSEEDFSENQSVISSKILSHVNTPKMIGGINQARL
jgi:hypothetical protein